MSVRLPVRVGFCSVAIYRLRWMQTDRGCLCVVCKLSEPEPAPLWKARLKCSYIDASQTCWEHHSNTAVTFWA